MPMQRCGAFYQTKSGQVWPRIRYTWWSHHIGTFSALLTVSVGSPPFWGICSSNGQECESFILLFCLRKQDIEQTVESPVISDTMTLMLPRWNGFSVVKKGVETGYLTHFHRNDLLSSTNWKFEANDYPGLYILVIGRTKRIFNQGKFNKNISLPHRKIVLTHHWNASFVPSLTLDITVPLDLLSPRSVLVPQLTIKSFMMT